MSRILLSSLKYSYLKLSYATVGFQNGAILKSTLPCSSCLISKCKYSSPATAARASENVDSRLNRMDQTVKRIGRTTLREVQGALRDLERAGSITATQALMMIRSCGNLLVEVKPEARTELVHRIWQTLKNMGVMLDISHYNALLRVYLENDHSFNPSDILSEIEKNGLEPNRVTCQRLISRYCQMGDIAGATRILQFMREKGMPINESVFNALISGHAEVNDMDSAEGILTLMRQSGLEPSSETYSLLICGFIKNGNLEKVEEIFRQCESMDVIFSDKDYFDIVFAYTMYGYHDEVDKVLIKMRKSAGYNHDAMNFAFKLLTASQPDTAYKILKSMFRTTRPDGSYLPLGNFFISYIIRDETPVDRVLEYCDDLVKQNLNPRAFSIALENAFRLGKEDIALDLLKEAKEKDLIPIRQHYFWPLLVRRGKKGDLAGMYELLEIMRRDFGLSPTFETLRDYVVPHALKKESDLSKIMLDMKSYGVVASMTSGSMVHHLLDEGKIKEAAKIAGEYVTVYSLKPFRASLIGAFYKTNDVNSFISILQDVSSHIYWFNNRETESEYEVLKTDHREYVGEIIEHVLGKILTSNPNTAKTLLRKLVEAEIGISESRVKSIQALIKDVFPPEIVNSLDKLSSDEFATPPSKTKTSKMSVNLLDEKALERLYEMAKAKGEESNMNTKRLLFIAYAKSGDLEKMNRIKEEMEGEGFVLNQAMQVYMIDAYLKNEKTEEALQFYQKLCNDDPKFCMNSTKTLNLAKYLVEHEQYDKAVEVVKRRIDLTSADDVVPGDNDAFRKRLAFKMLNKLSDDGNVEKTKEIFDLVVAAKLVEPDTYVLGPLIRAHIKRGDYDGALKEFENCVNLYKATPLKQELASYFIEQENAASLQKLIDLSTKVHGEANSLIDLMLVFVDSGRMKQAKKILETPGLYIRPERFEGICQSLLEKDNVESLLNLLKVTKDLIFIDRTMVYEKLLSFYDKENDTQNSLSLWLEIQEEDLQPSDLFLINLASLLTRNDMSVPFIVPEKKEPTISERRPSSRPPRRNQRSGELNQLLESGELDRALEMANSLKLGKNESSIIVEKLLQENRYTEAKNFFVNHLKKTNFMIHNRVFKFLLTQAVENSDVDFFKTLDTMLDAAFKKKMSFDNYWARAYLSAGRHEEYMTSWEKGLQNINNKEQLDVFLLKYPRIGILDIVMEHPECIPRVETFAQKCLEIDGKCTISNMLFNLYILLKNDEKASKIWNTYLKDTDKVIFAAVLRDVRKKVDPESGFKLLSFMKNNPNVSERTLALIYNLLIEVLVQRNEVKEAKKCFEEALTRVPIEELDRKALEFLKSACFDQNIDFPHEIPETPKRNLGRNRREKNRDEDSDSSDSD